ncbi:MAG: hypothetical protein ACE5F1_00945 [Planctomycetota bacterium]
MKPPSITQVITQQLDMDPEKDYTAQEAAVELKRATLMLRDACAGMRGKVVRMAIVAKDGDGVFLQITTQGCVAGPASLPDRLRGHESP